MPYSLLTLSPEILAHILSSLPSAKDIISCELSCRRLNAIVNGSAELQYLKELEQAGVHDPLLPGFSYPERLEKLRLWSKTWGNLDIPMFNLRMVVNLGDAPSNRFTASSRNGRFLITTDGYPSLHAHTDLIPSPVPYLHGAVGFDNVVRVEDGLVQRLEVVFNMDLLAVVSLQDNSSSSNQSPPAIIIRIRLLTLSGTQVDHPLATNPIIEIPLAPGAGIWYYLKARILGDRMVVVACQNDSQIPDEIFLVFWKTGTFYSLRRSPSRTYFPEVMFLSETSLVLIQKRDHALELCNITSGDTPNLETLCVLSLPPLQHEDLHGWATCTGDAISVSEETPPEDSCLIPFASDPNESMLCFVIEYTLGSPPQLAIFMRRRSLCEYASRGGGQTFLWDSWGPSATRCLELSNDGIAPHIQPSGSRIPMPLDASDDEEPSRIKIRDFHPRRLRHALALSQDPSRENDRLKIFMGPSTVERGDTFRDDIVSSLPYCEMTSEETYDYDEIVIDDERIVGMVFEQGRLMTVVHITTQHLGR